jgi:hypothetical protein
MKYQCKTNKDHIFDQLSDDYWCPLCEESKSMLEPVAMEQSESKVAQEQHFNDQLETEPSLPPAEPTIIASISTEDDKSVSEEMNKQIKNVTAAHLDFQFPLLLDGVITEFVLNGEVLFEFKAHKSFLKKVQLPQKAEINIRIKSKLLRMFQVPSKFELSLNLEKAHQLTFAYSRWTGKYKLDHKEVEHE